MKIYYDLIISDSEKRVDWLMKYQVLDKNRFDYGGIQISAEFVEVKSTIYKLTTAIAVSLNNKSRYYNNDELLDRIEIGIDYVKRMQREDGTFDLINCNFYSAPDTAFCIKRLLISYRILEKYDTNNKYNVLKDKIYEIINNAAYGIVNGGFHTPNHRWAIASILMACFNIIRDETLKNRAEQYLNEGIDCNEYGEYTERSAAVYNVVSNAAMITLYEETGDEKYIEYAKRNLEMMLNYFDSDGSIFTSNSTRQDKGEKAYPRDYFYQYLYLANKYNNKIFEGAAHRIIKDNIDLRYKKAPDCLDLLMLHEELLNYKLKEYGFPKEYNCYYPASESVRVQKNNMSYSIIKDDSRFLFFKTGKLQIAMKIGLSYFKCKAFTPQAVEKVGSSYVLKLNAKSWFYLPFEKTPDTSDWGAMKNENRDIIHKKDLNVVVTITEVNDGIDVNIDATGCDRVPIKVEIVIPSGSTIDSEYFYSEGKVGEALLVRKGIINIINDMDRISVGPAFGTHQFVKGKSGNEVASEENFTVYFTDFTEFNHTINIRTY